MTEKIATSQKWTQAQVSRFDTYDAAKAYFDTLTVERKRIRRRKATAHFDVVVYAPLKKAKAPDPEVEAAPVVEKKSKRAKNDKKGKRRGSSTEESLG